MKKLITLSLIAFTISTYAQAVISSVNSGAISNNNFSFSVGEIFVLPSDVNKINSGTMGVINQLQVTVTGITDKLSSDDFRAFPNPVSNTLSFKLNNEKPIEQLFIYDVNGKLVSVNTVTGNSADLTSLTNGAYIIKTNLENVAPFKIIKQ